MCQLTTNCCWRTLAASIDCTTFVRSRESTQFVLNTPLCCDLTAVSWHMKQLNNAKHPSPNNNTPPELQCHPSIGRQWHSLGLEFLGFGIHSQGKDQSQARRPAYLRYLKAKDLSCRIHLCQSMLVSFSHNSYDITVCTGIPNAVISRTSICDVLLVKFKQLYIQILKAIFQLVVLSQLICMMLVTIPQR